MGGSERAHPRLGVALDVAVDTPAGQWWGRIVHLTADTIKLRPLDGPIDLAPGSDVRLRSASLEFDPPLSLRAIVVQTSAESLILAWVNVSRREFQQLRDHVDSILQREWQELLDDLTELTRLGETGEAPTEPPAPEAEPREPARAEPPAVAAAAPKPEPEPVAGRREDAAPPPPAEPSVPPDLDEEQLQEVMARLGLEGLHLPADALLSAQWRSFLDRLASPGGRGGKRTDSRRPHPDP